MAAINRSLFSWDDVENFPDLKRLSLVLDYIPDEKIVQVLEKKRGNRRDDFPVRPMWGKIGDVSDWLDLLFRSSCNCLGDGRSRISELSGYFCQGDSIILYQLIRYLQPDL